MQCYRRALAPSVAESFPILYKTANGFHTKAAGPKVLLLRVRVCQWHLFPDSDSDLESDNQY